MRRKIVSRWNPIQIMPAEGWVACFTSDKDEIVEVPLVFWCLLAPHLLADDDTALPFCENRVTGFVVSSTGKATDAEEVDDFLGYMMEDDSHTNQPWWDGESDEEDDDEEEDDEEDG